MTWGDWATQRWMAGIMDPRDRKVSHPLLSPSLLAFFRSTSPPFPKKRRSPRPVTSSRLPASATMIESPIFKVRPHPFRLPRRPMSFPHSFHVYILLREKGNSIVKFPSRLMCRMSCLFYILPFTKSRIFPLPVAHRHPCPRFYEP